MRFHLLLLSYSPLYVIYNIFLLTWQRCKEEDPDLVTRFKPKKADKLDHKDRDWHREREKDHYKDKYQRDRDDAYIPSHSYEEREKKTKKKRDTLAPPSKANDAFFY